MFFNKCSKICVSSDRITKSNQIYFHLLSSLKVSTIGLLCQKRDPRPRERADQAKTGGTNRSATTSDAMATKDIYDESFFPPPLKQQGYSATKFKRYFNENNYERKPQLNSVSDNVGFWITRCQLFEPKECIFTGRAGKKKDSEGIAMAKALMWLRDNDYIDNSFDAIKTTEAQIRQFYELSNAPIDIKPIDNNLKKEMIRFCDDFDVQIKDNIINFSNCDQNSLNDLKDDMDYSVETEEIEEIERDATKEQHQRCAIVRNIFNNRPYEEPNQSDLVNREEQLKRLVELRAQREIYDEKFGQLKKKAYELPINKYKEQILNTIEENRVIVISGDTGCGKTTQIPQMIFENEILNERSAFTNIVVTQPRRLSAISIAERIAQELGEETVGQSIGYNVRFDKILPKYANGAILFCSSGILLRKLGINPSLKGVSHVIIDEVHERDVIIDFLLVLMKRVIDMNPNIKLILMSASMNADLFVKYFECPLIQIPGRCYDVKHFYLNDLSHKIGNTSSIALSSTNPKTDINTIVELIAYIDRTKGDGAILVFLAGWLEIQALWTALKEKNSVQNNLLITPVHSRLPYSIQKLIFSKPAVGVRKVILATNIAETSLTIDDVVYVIDTGLAKEMGYNPKFNVSNFSTQWISKANAKQRSGRAGRVREGECYRLWSRDIEASYMKEFPTPEMLRIPLENVVMQTKLYCSNESVAQFLSSVPEPPPQSSIEKAIDVLKDIQVLDKKEELTLLGQTIVNFPMHPRLSVALVYSSFLSCLKSMLALVSYLSVNREPFQTMPDEKHLIRNVKNNYSFQFISDHLSSVGLVLEYQVLSEEANLMNELSTFREDNHLHRYSVESILETMKLFGSHLEQSNICDQSWTDIGSDVNFNWHRKYLLISALVPAFMPNVVRLMRGEVRNQKIKTNCLNPIDINTGLRAKFVAESVFHTNFNSSPELDTLSNSLLLYYKSFFSEEARMLTVCDASIVSPIALLIYSNNKFDLDFSDKVLKTSNDSECVVVFT